MTYDCFSFFNELDLLEIRLNTLDKIVDKFILAESPFTHTGRPKPLYYAENKERFARFNDRIVHVVVDDFPNMPDNMPIREKAWIRENWQRNAIVRGLPKDIKDDDILLISDLDEIPHPDYVEKAIASPVGVTRLDLKAYCFFINLRNISYPIWNNGTRVLTWQTFNTPATYAHAGYSECCIASINDGPTATRIRFLKPTRILKPAGWHFSYLGGVEAIQRKMKSIAHTEFDTDERTSLSHIKSVLISGKSLFNSWERFLPELLDQSFPIFVFERRTQFRKLIADVPSNNNPSKIKFFVARAVALIHDSLFSIVSHLTPCFLRPLRHKIYTWITK